MPLPDVERVIYNKNPLLEVVFQARIPKYLPIETETPSEFQKLVVSDYPMYEQRSVFQIILAAPLQEGRAPPSEVAGKMHAFISADKVWTVTLSGDGVMLSTNKYVRWEDFRARLRRALESFLSVYRLPIFTRLGLRYQDLISREQLGLDGRRWAELLKAHVAGEFLGSGLDETDVTVRQTVLTLKLGSGDMLLLRHGLVTHKEDQKLAYLIDSDFYNEEQRAADLNGTLDIADRLHTNSGRLFRWCITDALHTAMDPQPVRS